MMSKVPSGELRSVFKTGQRDAESIPGSIALSTESTTREPRASGRLHFIDWVRLVMIAAVVFAHTFQSVETGGAAAGPAWKVDDRTFFHSPDYPAAKTHPVDVDAGPSPYAVRWVSMIRQWCLPLLFWVSGAAAALSYKGGMPRGLDKLVVITALGMASNAALWFLSPRKNECFFKAMDTPECKGQGILFDFSICGLAGAWFAILFQMWYTVVLFCLSLMNWPLFLAVHGSHGVGALCAEWLIMATMYSVFVLGGAANCPHPMWAWLQLCALEVVFLGIVALDAPLVAQSRRPRWLPVRLLHYLASVVGLIQFGWVRFADEMQHISPIYIAFMSTGWARFYSMGFVMTHARRSGVGGSDTATPLCSQAWPAVLLWLAIVSPSSNWHAAGMLSYPFFPSWVDRCLYIAGAFTVVFVIDRLSRGLPCAPLPDWLATSGLVLYLFHPVLLTLVLRFGMREVLTVWLAVLVLAFFIVSTVDLVWKAFWPPGERSGAESARQERKALDANSDDSDEEDEDDTEDSKHA